MLSKIIDKLNIDKFKMDESVVDLLDVIESEDEDEATACALFGGCDDTKCSYHDSEAFRRQPLYSCRTCATKQPAGICLGCANHCHVGHNLIELYTKRNFRCDCGNDKFVDNPCKLEPDKAASNPENKYDHNFEGKYCTCGGEEIGSMGQCVVCEDWFHLSHIERDIEEVAEIVCPGCSRDHKFIGFYLDREGCPLKSDWPGNVGFVCLPSGWRGRLCRCPNCLEVYREGRVEFLLDEGDSCAAYERRGADCDVLAGLDPSQKFYVAGQMRQFIDQFVDFADEFGESGRVVTKEDVWDFMDDVMAKRQRFV